MNILFKASQDHKIERIDHVDFCYPSYMDPCEIIAQVISYDGLSLLLDIDPMVYVRLNRDNNYFFKVQDGQLQPFEHTRYKVGVCETAVKSLVDEYNEHMLDALFPGMKVKEHKFFDLGKKTFGRYFSNGLNPRMLFLDQPEDDDGYPEGLFIKNENFAYQLDHNIVYVKSGHMDMVRRTHERHNVVYNYQQRLPLLYIKEFA